MTTLSYPPGSLAGDYARAGLGLAVSAGPIALVPVTPVVMAVLGSVALLFAGYGWQTFLRQRLRLELDDAGVLIRPRGARVAWTALQHLSLRYYSTRRDRRDGWFQLTVRSPGARLCVDSRIAGFESLLARALDAANARGLALSTTTTGNIASLGLECRPREGDG